MNMINIDVDNLVLILGKSVLTNGVEHLVNDTLNNLEELLQKHSFSYSVSTMGNNKKMVNVPPISIRVNRSEMEISRSVAYEIYRTLMKEGGL
jgi:hypothetical protein